jgi:hypothetical protein
MLKETSRRADNNVHLANDVLLCLDVLSSNNQASRHFVEGSKGSEYFIGLNSKLSCRNYYKSA